MDEIIPCKQKQSWKPERMFKDRLFRMIFSHRKELLSLYNAMSGTMYQNPEELEINTLENAIYMSMRNDLSFLIDSCLSLYEHQSTYNPNIPLRNLMYVSNLYSNIVESENIYGSRQISIPTPKFAVFYNGIDSYPDKMELRLSDAYAVKEDDIGLELKVVMLNINPGCNTKLMKDCKTLADYATYVDKVRTFTKTMPLEEAVELAIRECIEDGILAEFLRHHRAEAKSVSIFEYDEEKHMRQVKEEGLQEGVQTGQWEKEIELIKKKMIKNLPVSVIAEHLEEEPAFIEKVCTLLKENEAASVGEVAALMK